MAHLPLIFIVEDESAHFFLMHRAILREFPNASIQRFQQAEPCIEQLKTKAPDIVIVDYMMPGMNGLEFLEALNQMGIEVPVVMVTGQGNEDVAVRAVKAGAWDYLVKTADFFELLPCVITKVLRDKNTRDSLLAAEQQYRSVGDLLPFGFWLCGPDGDVRHLSASYLELVNLTIEQCRQFGWKERLPPEDVERTLSDWRACISSGCLWDYEFRIFGADGRYRNILSRGRPLRDAEDRITSWAGISLDITERKKNEDQLKHSLAQLELRNIELQDFAFAASHDLQEPLRKIQTFGDLLSEECLDILPPEHYDYLQRMIRSASRMRMQLQSLLSYSQVSVAAPFFTRIALEEIVAETLQNLKEQINRTGATVEVGSLPVIDGDPEQLQLLLHNLVSNAIKCAKKGEKPLLKIKGDILESAVGPQCELTIQDNGVGIDETGMRKIFRPFNRQHGKAKYDGAGMGLAVCRRIVVCHGGHITATSARGKGASFVITLPLRQETPMSQG